MAANVYDEETVAICAEGCEGSEGTKWIVRRSDKKSWSLCTLVNVELVGPFTDSEGRPLPHGREGWMRIDGTDQGKGIMLVLPTGVKRYTQVSQAKFDALVAVLHKDALADIGALL